MRRLIVGSLVALAIVSMRAQAPLDRDASVWVETTLKKLAHADPFQAVPEAQLEKTLLWAKSTALLYK